MTPVALAGPGVSSPTASTASGATPATSTACRMAIADGSDRRCRSLANAARGLDHPVDQELTVVGEHRRVRLGSPDIEPHHDRTSARSWLGVLLVMPHSRHSSFLAENGESHSEEWL